MEVYVVHMQKTVACIKSVISLVAFTDKNEAIEKVEELKEIYNDPSKYRFYYEEVDLI